MSGTKCAPARLNAEEQTRIRTALERAAAVSAATAAAGAAAARYCAAVGDFTALERDRFKTIFADGERAYDFIQRIEVELTADVTRVRAGANLARRSQSASGLPVFPETLDVRLKDLNDAAALLAKETDRILRLHDELAKSAVDRKERRERQRSQRARAALDQIRHALETDPAFTWVEASAREVLDRGGREIPAGIDDAGCARYEQALDQLRRDALAAEQRYHERVRIQELVRQVFGEGGFQVAALCDPARGSKEDVADVFRPTDERLVVRVDTRLPWALDSTDQQQLELTLESGSLLESTADPLCVERLTQVIQRARELGLEIGDVLQPTPDGGYYCVLQTGTVEASVAGRPSLKLKQR